MRVFVCIDDKNGTMFARRRQSQDSVLREYMLDFTKESKFYLSAYTATQFKNHDCGNVVVGDDLFEKATSEDFCFAEEMPLAKFADKIQTIYICKWNRTYPSDKKFDLDLNGFVRKEVKDIKGKSHDKITIEEWIKP